MPSVASLESRMERSIVLKADEKSRKQQWKALLDLSMEERIELIKVARQSTVERPFL